MNTKTNLKEIKEKNNVVPVNDAWPMLEDLSEINAGRFKIAKKSKATDIESLTQTINANALQDDKIIQKNVEKDEILISKSVAATKSKVVKSKKANELSEQKTQFNHVNKVESVEKEEVIAQQVPVNPQTTSAITSPVSRGLKEKASTQNKVTTNNLLKLIALGFGHLYMKSTNDILKPLGFVANNLSKVLMAFLHIGMPLMMTWLLTHKVNFVANQLANESPFLSLVYYGVFYVACLFIWITGVAIGKGLLKVSQKTLEEVAEVGKENT